MALTRFPNGVGVGANDEVSITDAGVTAPGFVGPLTGPVTPEKQVISVAGPTAITIKSGLVVLSRSGGAAAATLAAPVAGTDDGKILTVIATTAQAHTLTIANGLSGAGASADVGTFGGAVADRVVLQAYNGAWYPLVNVNVTFA